MENLKIESLKTNIVSVVGQSDLPIGSVYYLLKDVLHEIEKNYFNQVNLEIEDNKKNELEEEES